MSDFKTDGSTFPRFLSWLNFGGFWWAGKMHDLWVHKDRNRFVGVLCYFASLAVQLLLILVFIVPVTIGLFVYECAPVSLQKWLRKSTHRSEQP